MKRLAILFGLMAAPVAASLPAQDAPAAQKAEIIPAEKARDHVDKTITTEFTVKSYKNAESSKRYYLDSEADYKAENNLAVIITYDSAAAFEKAGIKDIIAHYADKKVRVTGKVLHESDQTRIYVTEPKQIELVGKK